MKQHHIPPCPADAARTVPGRGWRLHPLYVALSLLALPGSPAWARDYFDPAFLNSGDGSAPVDLSQYETAGSIPEGTYLVDIYVNQQNMATRQVNFARDDSGKVVPVLTVKALKDMGVAVSHIDSLKALADDAPVGDLSARIPQAGATLDMSQLRLNISVPQVYMDTRVAGGTDPSLWDEGISAARFNYTLSGSQNRTQGQDGGEGSTSRSLFASVNSGLNVGAWRLRSTLNASRYTNDFGGRSTRTQQTQWMNTYVQRDIQRLRGEMTLGETSTGGDIFDGIPFRGAQLVSSDDMLPNSQRGFAPIITGIARTNAQVAVSQNGYTIYQTSVPPGPFRITDIYQASSGGDLVVTVTEADGSKHVTTQAYSTLPIMQRPGGMEYEVTVGRYRNGGGTEGARNPAFALGTLVYGLPHYITLYGGGLASSDYQSLALGTGLSLGGLGALSADVTLSQATLSGQPDQPADRVRGAAYRARYSKSMLSTGTTLDLTAYRYATKTFYTFQDAATAGYRWHDDWAPWSGERKRSSWQTSINQTVGTLGSVFLRGTRDDYWGSNRVVTSLSAGFGSSIYGVSYNINLSEDHTRSPEGGWPTNRQVSLNVSVPLSLFSNAELARNISTSYTLSRDNNGRTAQQMGMNGTALNNALSWNASQSQDNQGSGASGNLGMGYQGSEGNLSLGYGYSSNTRTVNANASGGMLVTRHGVVMSPYLGDSVALVSAPGVSGAQLSGGGETNRWGYAAMPYLQNYQRNAVSLDPTTLPDGADITNNSVNVYPTKGAVVEATFRTRIGRQAMLTLSHGGKAVPFGATVSAPDNDGQPNSSIVGDGGMVYLAGLPQKGELQAQWGRGPDQQCRVSYDLGDADRQRDGKTSAAAGIVQREMVCK